MQDDEWDDGPTRLNDGTTPEPYYVDLYAGPEEPTLPDWSPDEIDSVIARFVRRCMEG